MYRVVRIVVCLRNLIDKRWLFKFQYWIIVGDITFTYWNFHCCSKRHIFHKYLPRKKVRDFLKISLKRTWIDAMNRRHVPEVLLKMPRFYQKWHFGKDFSHYLKRYRNTICLYTKVGEKMTLWNSTKIKIISTAEITIVAGFIEFIWFTYVDRKHVFLGLQMVCFGISLNRQLNILIWIEIPVLFNAFSVLIS